MEKLLGRLIIVDSASTAIIKFRYTRTAVAILVASFLLSFCVVAILGFTFPPLVTDRDRQRLEMENEALRVQNLNMKFGMQKVTAGVSRIETQTQKIEDLMSTE